MPLSETYCYVLLKEHPCGNIIHTFCEFTHLKKHNSVMCSICSSLVIWHEEDAGGCECSNPCVKSIVVHILQQGLISRLLIISNAMQMVCKNL